MPAFVSVQQLTKRYDAHEAVRGVSFEIVQGEVFGLLGPNGAGKTSILECLSGLREPDSGAICIAGLDARQHSRALKEKIGVVLQSTHLPDKITPREALILFGSFYRQSIPTAELLTRFNLTPQAEAHVHTLSGGQRQRLALALAFVNRPELILLDEPTAGLDPGSRRALQDEILQLKTSGHTVLLSTHYLEEAARLCDRIAIIHHGRIIATGSPQELVGDQTAQQKVILRTTPALPAAVIASLPAILNFNPAQPGHFQTGNPTLMLAAISELLRLHSVTLDELQVTPMSLEDVFLQLIASNSTGSLP